MAKKQAKKKPAGPPGTTEKVALMPSPSCPAIPRTYRKNFLKQVIARMDFGSAVPSLREGPPKAVISALKAQFPVPEQKKQVVDQVLVTPDGVQRTREETFQWYYHSKDRNKVIYIGPDAMYVQYTKYERFEFLQHDFLTVTNALFDEFHDLQVKRLGLRYIDNIEFPGEAHLTDWTKYLHQDLLASFCLTDDPSKISRAFHVLEFNYGDMNLRFQYGMPNPDFPAPIRKKLFTLDYDAYCTLLLGRDEIAQRLTDFHGKLKAMFEQVITDGLRNVMGIIRAK